MFDALDRLDKKSKSFDKALEGAATRTIASTDGGVFGLMARVSPHLHEPTHFALYAQLFETAIGGAHRVVFSAPPQHGKSLTTLHGLAYLIINHPDLKHAYMTYSQERANSVSVELQRILRSCGIEVEGTLSKIRWKHGTGSILMTSIEGGITGEPINGLAVVDDPIKNIQEATSSVRRNLILETFRTSVQVRVHKGCSIIVMMTRWDPQDLSGTLIKTGDWTHINIPAIAKDNDILGRAEGEALFPELWPIDELQKIRKAILDESFAALYQGRPRLKGGKIFHEPTYYTALPSSYQGAYGIDLAYTATTSGDWSICVELLKSGELFYVRHVDRARVEAPEFALVLKTRQQRRPGWSMLWRCAGPEKGVAQIMKRLGVKIKTQSPPGDKYVSSMDVAAAWNDGKVLVPDLDEFPEAEIWMSDFLTCLLAFTGNNKEQDDDVDGLGNAYHALRGASYLSLVDNRPLPKMRM